MFNNKKIKLLEERICALEKRIDEISKRTISQKTLQDEPMPSASQILDEWLNGESKTDGN